MTRKILLIVTATGAFLLVSLAINFHLFSARIGSVEEFCTTSLIGLDATAAKKHAEAWRLRVRHDSQAERLIAYSGIEAMCLMSLRGNVVIKVEFVE